MATKERRKCTPEFKREAVKFAEQPVRGGESGLAYCINNATYQA
jgi:hypothetical protein